MAAGKPLREKPYAADSHVRFGEGEVAATAVTRRRALFGRNVCFWAAVLLAAAVAIPCQGAYKKVVPAVRLRQIAPVRQGELRLRPTFNSCGVCWGAGREIADIRLNWRRRGEQTWHAVPELPYFAETKDCRASILGLAEDTDYEMNISAAGRTLAEGSFRTWKSEVPIARTVEIDPATATFPIEISAKGRPDGWVRYTTKDGHPLANATTNTTLSVKGAEHVIIENIDFRGCRGTVVVRIDECTGVRIRNCEFSGFGREVYMDFFKGGLGIYRPYFAWTGYDTAIRIGTGAREVVVERCYVHDAHYPSSSWIYSHPCGPNAIYMCKPDHSTVLRWNDLVGSDEIRWNDAVEGCGNFHADGGFNRDADIYGNFMIFSNDDAIELDGGNQNVRCFGNRFESKVSIQGTMVSPTYVFDNLFAGICDEFGRVLTPIKTIGIDLEQIGTSVNIFSNTFVGAGLPIDQDGVRLAVEL